MQKNKSWPISRKEIVTNFRGKEFKNIVTTDTEDFESFSLSLLGVEIANVVEDHPALEEVLKERGLTLPDKKEKDSFSEVSINLGKDIIDSPDLMPLFLGVSEVLDRIVEIIIKGQNEAD